jgi:hypothetical protein
MIYFYNGMEKRPVGYHVDMRIYVQWPTAELIHSGKTMWEMNLLVLYVRKEGRYFLAKAPLDNSVPFTSR